MVCAPSEFIQQNGRQLSSLQKGNNRISYTYDSGSVRATKTVDGVKYTYQYINGKLIHETRGEKSFHYYYDALGYLTAIKYRLTTDGSEYAYYATHNSRGDVLGLYNGNGALVAEYEYDSWGNVLSIKNAAGAIITDQNHVGNLNAIRYRGYYQDTETGLYYLMSRYYDPVTHRFLNADGYFQSGTNILDANMNAYCRNNPVNFVDPMGTSCHYGGDPKYHPGCHTGSDGFCYSCYTQDCCWPSERDKNIPEKPKPTYFDKVVETVGAVLYSPTLEFGAGYGLGGSAQVSDYIEASALIKTDLVNVKLSPQGCDIGMEFKAEASISVGLDASWDNTQWQSYLGLNGIEDKSGTSTGFTVFSVGAYMLGGGSCSLTIDTDYIATRIAEIWR